MTPDVSSKKAAMRTSLRTALRALDPARFNAMCAEVHARFVRHHAVASARSILLYAAVESWQEFETAALAGHLMALGKRVAVPRADLAHPRAAWVGNWDGDLTLNPSGAAAGRMRAPREDLADAEPAAFDVAIVPGLAFDLHGRRLGRGGGYYDRLLPQLRADAWRIGAAWEIQIVDEVPIEPHDQRVHAVVTERRVIEIARPGAGGSGPARTRRFP